MTTKSLNRLFGELERLGYSIDQLAILLALHPRTIRDWRRGKYTITGESLNLLVQYANLALEEFDMIALPNQWHYAAAGRVGGRKYIERYGVLGTVETRRAGGQSSYKKRVRDPNDIFARTTIAEVSNCPELAEFIGIMIGDGSVGRYQISVTLDLKTDAEYASYVRKQMEVLFGVMPRYREREHMGCSVTEISSINMVEFLKSKGLPVGNKLQHDIHIPAWIRCNPKYAAMCLRGIFDTDGSIFQEQHVTKNGKVYAYPRMAFVSASERLRNDIFGALFRLGLRPKIRSNRAVTIEHFTDIKEYFRIVGSSNPKHLHRFITFGGVG